MEKMEVDEAVVDLSISSNRSASPVQQQHLPPQHQPVGIVSTNTQSMVYARRVLRPRTEPRSYVESPDVLINGSLDKPRTNGNADYSSDSSEGEMPPLAPIKELSPSELKQRFGMKEKVDKHLAWTMRLNMAKPATKYMKVCSLHFKKDDFILPDVPTKKPRLKSIAVPSQNLPEKSIVTKTKEPRRILIRKVQTTQLKSINDIPCTTNESQPNETANECEQPERNISTLENEAVQALLQLQEIPKKDQCIQVSSGDFVTSFISTITSDKALNTMTGVPSFALFNTIVTHCEEVFGKFTKKIKLSFKECVLLTFMKLKHALSYAFLSLLFKTITAAACCKIVHETLIMLAKVLSLTIYLPSIEEIRLNTPACFQHFRKARLVIDCTEIPVQRVKNLSSRIKTYSNYKKTHTIKFMTAVTPGGFIAFVSKGYPGRFSDKVIFAQSGLLEKLEIFQDEVMVDKGFLIQNITDSHGIKVIQPPFLRKQKQFSKETALLNQKIAKARVHIERVNQRIKIFDIFKKPLPSSLWSRVDDIFIIACAVVNLSKPVLDDCRFLNT